MSTLPPLFPRRSSASFQALAPSLLTLLLTLPALPLAAAGATLQTPATAGAAGAQIERFLLRQTPGLPGKVSIRVDASMLAALPPCATPEPFLPGGSRLWGRLSVGLRCNTDPSWTRYVSTYIAVQGPYYVATRQINAGQALTPADTQLREGDLTTLPGGIVADAAQLGGVVAATRIASGALLRREMLRAATLVQRGQSVKVVAQGSGFVVSSEGKAMTDAPAGTLIQVKMQGGQLLSGIVRPDGMVQRSP